MVWRVAFYRRFFGVCGDLEVVIVVSFRFSGYFYVCFVGDDYIRVGRVRGVDTVLLGLSIVS